MRNYLPLLPGAVALLGCCLPAFAQAQASPAVGAAGAGQVKTTTAPAVANEEAATQTTTTVTYRGQRFSVKRTPDNLFTGVATDRIAQLENQLSFCYAILLADTLNPTCPPEREATIRAAIKYIGLNRLNWDQRAYLQEFKFYLAEDKRRRRANDY